VHGPRFPKNHPGLYFTGFTNPISGMFRELAIDARKIARSISHNLSHRRAKDTPSSD
jgi:putative flavoprotein involved in K+ transport